MKTRKTKRHSARATLLLLLLFSVILLSSSYAWFTANQTVTISQLEVNVAAQGGLQISADGSKWSALVNKSDLVTAASTYSDLINQFPSAFEAVSTAGNVTDGKMDMFAGTVLADENTGIYELTAEKQTEVTGTTGKFIAFDIFFKVEKATNIELTSKSGVKLKSGSTSQGIQNAARVAFLVQGTKPDGTALSTIQKQNGATTESGRYIWEPNYDVHTAAATQAALGTYGLTISETGEERISYDGVKATITDGIALADAKATGANTAYFATTPIAYSTTAAFGTNVTDAQAIFQLPAGITKVRVYMWIEGQDVDCENNASGADITFDMQIKRSATQPSA